MIRFTVHGHPAPGGSKNPIPIPDGGGPYLRLRDGRRVRIVLADAGGVANKKWRAACLRAAREAWAGFPVPDFPVGMRITFWLPRPKSHYRTGRFSGVRRDDAPEFPAVSPDCLKLARSTEDALKGVCYVDDALIVRQSHAKVYAPSPGAEGATIEVYGILAADDAKIAGTPEE